jgi:hypothetical protein
MKQVRADYFHLCWVKFDVWLAHSGNRLRRPGRTTWNFGCAAIEPQHSERSSFSSHEQLLPAATQWLSSLSPLNFLDFDLALSPWPLSKPCASVAPATHTDTLEGPAVRKCAPVGCLLPLEPTEHLEHIFVENASQSRTSCRKASIRRSSRHFSPLYVFCKTSPFTSLR